jgi:hypothetical protein
MPPTPDDGIVRVSRETSGRRGKTVTVVRGLPLRDRFGCTGPWNFAGRVTLDRERACRKLAESPPCGVKGAKGAVDRDEVSTQPCGCHRRSP